MGRNKQDIKEELEYYKSQNIRVKILNVPTTLMECEGQDWIVAKKYNLN